MLEAEKIVATLLQFTNHKEDCKIGYDKNHVMWPCSCGLNRAIGNLYKITAEHKASEPLKPKLAEGYTFWRIFSDAAGKVLIESNYPDQMQTLEFALMLKGAFVTGFQDISQIIRATYSSGPEVIDQDDELGEIIGGGDGAGPTDRS